MSIRENQYQGVRGSLDKTAYSEVVRRLQGQMDAHSSAEKRAAAEVASLTPLAEKLMVELVRYHLDKSGVYIAGGEAAHDIQRSIAEEAVGFADMLHTVLRERHKQIRGEAQAVVGAMAQSAAPHPAPLHNAATVSTNDT